MQYEIRVQKGHSDGNLEAEVLKKITREKFFSALHDQNIDLKYLMRSFKEDSACLSKFNFFVRMIKVNHHINIYETMLFIEEEGYKLKTIMSLLCTENKAILHAEMAEKFKLKKSEPSIIDKYIIE